MIQTSPNQSSYSSLNKFGMALVNSAEVSIDEINLRDIKKKYRYVSPKDRKSSLQKPFQFQVQQLHLQIKNPQPVTLPTAHSPNSSPHASSRSRNDSSILRNLGVKKYSVDQAPSDVQFSFINNLKRIEKNQSWYHRALLDEDPDTNKRIMEFNKT